MRTRGNKVRIKAIPPIASSDHYFDDDLHSTAKEHALCMWAYCMYEVYNTCKTKYCKHQIIKLSQLRCARWTQWSWNGHFSIAISLSAAHLKPCINFERFLIFVLLCFRRHLQVWHLWIYLCYYVVAHSNICICLGNLSNQFFFTILVHGLDLCQKVFIFLKRPLYHKAFHSNCTVPIFRWGVTIAKPFCMLEFAFVIN